MGEFESGVTRTFECPMCGHGTEHRVVGKRGASYAAVCTSCQGGVIVGREAFDRGRYLWNEELQAMIDALGRFDERGAGADPETIE